MLGALFALAALAWLITDDRMGGMEAMPGMGLGGLGFYVSVWVVMMAAMMFPAVAPTVLMYDRLRAGHRARGKGAAADATAPGAYSDGCPPQLSGQPRGASTRLSYVHPNPAFLQAGSHNAHYRAL